MKRGLFIVLEGIDGAGKTAQIKRLEAYFKGQGVMTHTMVFPDRNTTIGSLINAYLQGTTSNVPKECLHLLFSANRWEKQKELHDVLASGTTVLCDRYAYSGVAYSVAVHGLDVNWCLEADKGLIKPDLVFQIAADPSECARRRGYGDEVYEKLQVQEEVAKVFNFFHASDNWNVIYPNRSPLQGNAQPSAEQSGTNVDSVEGSQEATERAISEVHQQLVEHLRVSATRLASAKTSALGRLGNAKPW